MMRLFRIALIGLTLGSASIAAFADVVDTVRFEQAPVLMVWTDNDTPQIGSEVDLNGPRFVPAQSSFPGAGQLEPIQAVAQSSTRVQRFRIASNSGFALQAVALNAVETSAAPISINVRYPGDNADASLIRHAVTSHSLSTLSSHQTLLDVSRKTAARPGAPVSQSIEIEIDWGALPMGEVAIRLIAVSK